MDSCVTKLHSPKIKIPESLRKWLSKWGKKGADGLKKVVTTEQRKVWGSKGGLKKSENLKRKK